MSTTTTADDSSATMGSDPVTWYNNKRRMFWMPNGKLMPILYAREMTLYGQTFAGNPSEQWFERLVVANADGFRFVEVVIKKNIGERNRSGVPRDAFETLDVTIGAAKLPLQRMLPCCKEYAHRMGLHLGMMKMDEMKQRGPPSISQVTMGGVRREVVLVACPSAHIMITSSPAGEYFGDHAYLAVKYAHLDIVILHMHDRASLKGLLPELWGFRPLSNRTKSMMIQPEVTPENGIPGKHNAGDGEGNVFVWT